MVTLYNKVHWLTWVNLLTNMNLQCICESLLMLIPKKYSCSLFVHVNSQCINKCYLIQTGFNSVLVNVEVNII